VTPSVTTDATTDATSGQVEPEQASFRDVRKSAQAYARKIGGRAYAAQAPGTWFVPATREELRLKSWEEIHDTARKSRVSEWVHTRFMSVAAHGLSVVFSVNRL